MGRSGIMYFDDARHMRNTGIFCVGVAIVAAGLLVLSRAKEQRAKEKRAAEAANATKEEGEPWEDKVKGIEEQFWEKVGGREDKEDAS